MRAVRGGAAAGVGVEVARAALARAHHPLRISTTRAAAHSRRDLVRSSACAVCWAVIARGSG
eukprot:3361485-Prymnesium_polylepis.1